MIPMLFSITSYIIGLSDKDYLRMIENLLNITHMVLMELGDSVPFSRLLRGDVLD